MPTDMTPMPITKVLLSMTASALAESGGQNRTRLPERGERDTDGKAAPHLKEKTEHKHDGDLDAYDPHRVLNEDERACGNRAKVNRHADGHKEEADEEPLVGVQCRPQSVGYTGSRRETCPSRRHREQERGWPGAWPTQQGKPLASPPSKNPPGFSGAPAVPERKVQRACRIPIPGGEDPV